ncbi:hypothetical protein KSP39_PZI017556 [Platanthera zijinensis]|uniref:Uncharacterized protein n=1 Tax=Platanthera zijinensis TaxID=2320716 RepID=A0AAP0B5W6_9ASPA
MCFLLPKKLPSFLFLFGTGGGEEEDSGDSEIPSDICWYLSLLTLLSLSSSVPLSLSLPPSQASITCFFLPCFFLFCRLSHCPPMLLLLLCSAPSVSAAVKSKALKLSPPSRPQLPSL